MSSVYGRPCPHGHPPGTCKACREAALRGAGADRRHDALAGMAASIAAGMVNPAWLADGEPPTDAEVATLAATTVAIARAILEEVER
jgi:hypothetical protein